MTRLSITSTSNARLKTVRRLRREREGRTFLAEGERALRHALRGGAPVREVYAAPRLFLGPSDRDLVRLAERQGAAVLELSRDAFLSISTGIRPDGLAAVVERWPTPLSALRLPPRPLVAVAEGIERPGNLGTIVRTASAAGANALVVCDGRTSIFHPETVRASVGAIFRLPIAETATKLALPWLAGHGVRILVATPHASQRYWDVDLTDASALVVGNERHGVTGRWLEEADEALSIPMPGPADSLNVAAAAAVLVLEAVRQRAGACAAEREPLRPV